jgi:hypothetical protein
MPASPFPAKHQKLQAAMKQGFMTFIEAAKSRPRPQLRVVPSSPTHSASSEPRIDPVELTVLAVNRLGLATFRTATSGKVSTVAVPDACTAEIFRAALREMQKARQTDRLIDVVVSADDGSRGDRPGDGRGRDAVKA